MGALTARAEVLTLKEAVQRALENSPTIVAERATLQIRKSERENAGARWFPSLDLISNHGVQKSSPGLPNDPWVSSFGLSLTENLYDNHETITQQKITSLNEEIAQISNTRAKEQLSLDVAAEFYRFSLAKELIALKQQQLELIKKQFVSVSSQYKQGMGTRKDFLRLSTQVKRGEIELRNAENSALGSSVELRRLIGADIQSEVGFQPLSSTEALPVVPTAPPAIEKLFDVQMADKRRAVGPLNVYLAQRKYWPQLNLKSEAYYRNSDYLGPSAGFGANENYGWSAALQLSFNLLDWGIRDRDIQIARSGALIQEADLQKAKLQGNAQLKRLMLDIGQLKRNYDLARELRAAEEETYKVIRGDYEQGKVPYLDLITALKDFLESRSQVLTAHFGLLEAIAKHQFYGGELYETVTR